MNNYTVKELLFAIKNKESLEARAAETGNFDILSPVMDAEMAVKNAGFTDRQMYIFKKYYVQDFTLAMIADELEISHQGVADCLAQCRKKLQKYIDREVEQC